jgi:hypothetical protein
MNNATLQLKIKQRLNKLASNDYDNIECWQIVEAFNKAQIEWVRRQLHGNNMSKEGDEESKRRVDDLQQLLVDSVLNGADRVTFFESTALPANYMEFKRVSAFAKDECCPERSLSIYHAEEADIDQLLRDRYRTPNFEWAETFCTLLGDRIRIYTNDKFEIVRPRLFYYRKPINIQILNCVDPYTQVASTVDVPCEFRDDIAELLIDEAAAILAGDIESMLQYQRGTTSAERSN